MGTEYYVSPSGNDNNPGTKKKPFKTFKTVIAKAKGGDTVWIRGGTYQEPLIINKSCKKPLIIKK